MSEVKRKGGRPAGSPNKATAEARQAIASFVDGNAHRLSEWLDQVAEGVRDDEGKFVVQPNPAKAFDMFQSVVEYHVPKLARMEVGGTKDGAPIKVEDAGSSRLFELIKQIEMKKRVAG